MEELAGCGEAMRRGGVKSEGGGSEAVCVWGGGLGPSPQLAPHNNT